MIDWQALYSRDYILVPDCWQGCGGYCCGNFLAGDTSLPGGNEVVVPFLPGEYAHHLALGGIAQSTRVVSQDYVLPDGSPFTAHFLRCSARGRCEPHGARPLVCRIYPYFPLVDIDGAIEGFEYGSLMDLFFPGPATHPCTLVRESGEEIKARLSRELAPALAHPELVFAFALARLITAALRRSLPGTFDPSAPAEERRAFLRAFEWRVFSRKPWATPEFKEEVARLHAAMTRRHGRLDLG